jgi:hypothetical protein
MIAQDKDANEQAEENQESRSGQANAIEERSEN